MQGLPRKITQAMLYETMAIVCVAPATSALFGQSLVEAGGLSLVLSSLAMLWNLIYNNLFERWESRQRRPGRSLTRRILHACGFEGGLIFILAPVVVLWLHISWWDALGVDLGLFGFYLGYAFVFQWAFDHVFGPPQATLQASVPGSPQGQHGSTC